MQFEHNSAAYVNHIHNAMSTQQQPVPTVRPNIRVKSLFGSVLGLGSCVVNMGPSNSLRAFISATVVSTTLLTELSAIMSMAANNIRSSSRYVVLLTSLWHGYYPSRVV